MSCLLIFFAHLNVLDIFSTLLAEYPDKCEPHLELVIQKVVSLILALVAIPTFGKKAERYYLFTRKKFHSLDRPVAVGAQANKPIVAKRSYDINTVNSERYNFLHLRNSILLFSYLL